MSLEKFADKYKIEDIKPINIYQKSNNKILKNIFTKKDVKEFEKNLDVNVTSLMSEFAKTSGIDIKIIQQSEQQSVKEAVDNQQTNQQNPTQQNPTQQGIEPEKMKKFKDSAKNFMTNGFIGPLTKELNKSINTGPSVQREVQALAKSIPASKNLDSKKALLGTMKNIRDPKILASVRDTLASNNLINKDDANKMKF